MFETLFERHRELQRRRADEGFDGFTLIELLIVIVVIAILAATVIFALGGITGSSAQASCDSDAKSVEVAVTAFKNFPGNAGVALPASSTNATTGVTTNAGLTGTANGGPFLRTFPNNIGHYTITTDANGNVSVTPKSAVNGGVSGTPYDYDKTTNATTGAPVDPCTYVS